jgi:hypothetical protein
MSSPAAIISALNRAISRIGMSRTKFRGSEAVRAFEEALLREAAACVEGSPELVEVIEASIRDVWQKPLPPTVVEKQRRVGALRQAVSRLTVRDTPLEMAIERNRMEEARS